MRHPLGVDRQSFAAHVASLRSAGPSVVARCERQEDELPRPARVVRVAPLPLRSDRAAELQRIFGTNVDVTETSVTERSHVAAVAASVEADAVLLDVVDPASLGPLVRGLSSEVLLRPILDFVRTSRGEQQPVFVGYGRLTAGGNIEPLADGALMPLV